MMIDPPIDKLIKKAECRYALVCGVAKRARQLETQYPELLEDRKSTRLNSSHS